MADEHNRVVAAIDALARGEMIVVGDDNDRENEADLMVAAEHVTVEMMAFMIRYTSGIICVAIDSATAERLELPPMVERNTEHLHTAFTITVDAANGVTTGISAADRTKTAHVLANPKSRPTQLTCPGHVFPLVAREGGILTRRGHTEASVDLARLAGLKPAIVLSELMNDNGTVITSENAMTFAKKHKLHHITVKQLHAYLLAQ